MRALSVIITPPSYRASGGVSAGLTLAEHIATLIDMEAAIMSDHAGTSLRGELTIRHFLCTNRLGVLERFAPRQLAATLWKSGIPKHIESVRPDIVHFHNPFPPLALLEATRMCRRLGIPFVISSHGFVEMSRYGAAYNLRQPASTLAKFIVEAPFMRAVRNADRVFILSPLERETVSGLGIPPERQNVVTNGVNAEFATPVATDLRDALAQRLGWRADVMNLLFVGNLTFNKGIDLLLGAMKRTNASVRLIVAGALRSPDQANILLRKAGLTRDDQRIIFTDHLRDDELRALYQMADVFVFPSRADTLPLVILEAMISGLPVIASDVGGIPFQVTLDTGIIFPSEDASALAAAIGALADDPSRRRRMSATARARAISHFSWDQAATEAVRVYTEILNVR